MSIEAIEWVLRHAPDLEYRLFGVLVAYANHADAQGTGAYPATATVALETRKSDRQVQRDTDELVARGLLRLGDQDRAAHLPADRRPVVYDVAMDRRCPDRERAWASQRERRFVRGFSHRGDTHVTPMDANGVTWVSPRDPNGVTPEAQRGDTQSTNGVSLVSPDPSLDPSPEPSPLSKRVTPSSLLAAAGIHPDERELFVEWLQKTQNVQRPDGWIITAAGNDTLAGQVGKWRASLKPDPIRRGSNPWATGELDTKPPPEPCGHGVTSRCDACTHAKVAADLAANGGRWPASYPGWMRAAYKRVEAARKGGAP